MTEIILNNENAIVNIKDKLPILATKEYLNYKSNNYGWFLSDNFILPFYLTKKIIFKRLFFTTEVIYLEEASLKEEKYFLNEVINISRLKKIDIIDVPQTNAIFNTYPDNSIYANFGTYRVDLSLSEEELFKNLHPKNRNKIRKAMKDKIIIKNGNKYIRECYDIIRRTYLRQNKNFISYEEFEGLKIFLKENVSFYVALKANEIQGCAVLLWNIGHSCYYLFGGSINSLHSGSINYLHWQAILDMKKNNVKWYDFYGARINPEKGSKLEGIQRFKQRFGGKLKIGYLWKYSINPFKAFLLRIIFRFYCLLKRRKYMSDIIDQERKRNIAE